MIVDNLRNAHLYYSLSKRILIALNYLKENDLSSYEPGRYQIDGEDIYVLVQSYTTKPEIEGRWEAHKRHIDIQYVISGTESMGYADLSKMKIVQEYDTQKYILFLKGSGYFITVNSGDFAIFSPTEVHMPCIAAEKPELVKKAVVKVRI